MKVDVQKKKRNYNKKWIQRNEKIRKNKTDVVRQQNRKK